MNANLGYNRVRVDVEEGVRKGIWFKNVDNFSISTLPGAHQRQLGVPTYRCEASSSTATSREPSRRRTMW